MASVATATADVIFSSVASDIKSYSGKDPLLPWLRGIKKLKESLPPTLLKAKLPRFLQKCAQTFESDKRYKNDPRYLRVWLQLMDYVDEPRLLLRTMEKNQIGMKRSLFYQAYALCYEKMKKYEEAEKMYHLGVQNLAEPVDELQRSYEEFLRRMQRHKNKKSKLQTTLRVDKRPHSAAVRTDENNENVCTSKAGVKQIPDGRPRNVKPPLVESNCHGSNEKSGQSTGGFEVYVDSNMEIGGTKPLSKAEKKEPLQVFVDDEEQQGGECGSEEEDDDEDSPFVFPCPQDLSSSEEGSRSPRNKLMREDTVVHRFVGSTISNEPRVENVCHHGLVDPTVNLKEAMEDINNMFGKPIEFVRAKRAKQPVRQEEEEEEEQQQQQQLGGGGFFILPDDDKSDGKQSQPAKKQEQQHGGVFFILPDDDDDADEKQNQKGKKRQEEAGGFSILPDDVDVDVHHHQQSKKPSSDARGSDLFEPTVFTKQAMDDINKLFGMPLDF